MKRLQYFIPAVLMTLSSAAALAQATPAYSTPKMFRMFGNADIGVAAAGQFTTSITDQTVQLGAGPHQGYTLPHETTTNSPGALVTLHMQPKSWAGVEVNYQFTRFSERFFAAPSNAPYGGANTPYFAPTSVHEGTGAYMFHVKMHKLKPYIGIGGGVLDFQPSPQFHHQVRGTGLVDVGLDMQTKSRLGFRIGARDLVYRAPNFANSYLSSSRWVSTEEPYAGVYVKF